MIELAGCVIRDEQCRILLLHRNTPQRVQWEVPGGKVEAGEGPERTAIREVAEELGVTVVLTRCLGRLPFAEGEHVMCYTWYLADIVDGIPTAREDAHDECRYLPLDELVDRDDLSAAMQVLVAGIRLGSMRI